MSKVMHYQHPKMPLGYHACGMGNPRTATMTDAIKDVTCKRCLGTITGQNAGRPTHGDRPKESLTTRIDANLKEAAIEANLSFSGLLEEAIRAKLALKL